MSSIPSEIYFEILLRLPVKSILICKCVCKTWFSIISDPVFVKLHLYNSQRNNNKLVFANYDHSKQTYVMHSVGYDALCSSSSKIKIDVIEIPYSDESKLYLLCSCNGLVCVRCYYDTTRIIFLWNPATAEYIQLPKSPNEYAETNIRVYALGYDHKTDDYKLIVVVDIESMDSYLVDVYTLKSNSWKSSTQFIPYMSPYSSRKSGVLVNGALHWTPDKDSTPWLIICLDISDEKFQELQLPKRLGKSKQLSVTVGVLDECLCVLTSYMVDLEVWVMQDYGIQGSWTKRYNVSREVINMHGFRHNVSLIWSFKGTGVLLLRNWGCLTVYVTKHSSVRDANRRVTLVFHPVENYFESLVSLNSGNHVGER